MKEQSVAKGFAVLSLAGIVVKLLSLLYIPFLIAIIGEEGNGIYAAAYQVYVLVYVLTNSGIPVAISKLVSELIALKNYRDAVRSFKIARFLLLIVGTFMASLMMLTANNLAIALHFEKSSWAILALSPTLLFTAIASAYRGYFQGRGNMVPTAVSQIIEQVVNTIFTLVFAALFMRISLKAACAGGTIGTSLGALFSVIYLTVFYRKNRKFIVPKGQIAATAVRYSYRGLVKKIANYSIPITLCIGMQYAGNLVDLWNTKSRLLTAGFADKAATEMYSYLYKYQQLLNAPIAVVAALAATILPAVSAAMALRNKELVQDRVNYAFRLCFLVTIPSATGFSVLSSGIFKLLKYGPGSYLMLYGSVALALLAIVQIQTSILQGSGRLYTVTFNLILGIMGKIVTNYFFVGIPQINITGAIIGSVVGYCIPIVLNTLAISKSLKINASYFGLAAKPAIASLFMGIIVYFTYHSLHTVLLFVGKGYLNNAISTLIAIFTGVVSYFVTLVLIKGIRKEELDLIPSRFVKLIPHGILKRITA